MSRNLRLDLQMFLENIRLRIENNSKNLGKTVLQLWSQIGQKVANSVSQTKNKKKMKKYCVTKVKTNIIDLSSHFSPNQRPHFQNSFS